MKPAYLALVLLFLSLLGCNPGPRQGGFTSSQTPDSDDRRPVGVTPNPTKNRTQTPTFSELITIRGVHIQGKEDVLFNGESTLPEGSCILTQLYENEQPLVWWPSERCAQVKFGRWELSVRLSEEQGAPEELRETEMYILRAWQKDDPAIEAQYFPFDLQGPPPESILRTSAPMASLPGTATTSITPEMSVGINAPADTHRSTSIADPVSHQDLDTEIVFTIVNEEQFSGREGDPKPDWLAWGAQSFTIASDSTYWIADSAAEPPRLLHFSPYGEWLREVSLEGLVVSLEDVVADGASVLAFDTASQPPKVLRFAVDGTYLGSHNLDEGLRSRELAALDGSYYADEFVKEPGPVVQWKRIVRRYSPEGMLLGDIELPDPAVYAQDDLALGPDGNLYFMISREDHSVEIWRLGFGGNPFPEEEVTPTPKSAQLTPLLPTWETPLPGTDNLELARWTLLSFFALLNDGRFGEAAALFGGGYEDLPIVRDDLPPTSENKAQVWESECQLLQCLLVSSLVEETKVSLDEYIFIVEFMNEDGTLFVLGPCCGATEAEMPPVWQFKYRVKWNDGRFRVMDPPVYVP